MNPIQNLATYSEIPLTTQILLDILKDYRRPYDKLMELVNQGFLVQLRRGLYHTSGLVSPQIPEPFCIANHLYGPSYVSQDAALAYWGLIPERVYTVSSVTTNPSKEFRITGTYTYTHLSSPYYSFGIQSLALTPRQTILIASPEKALCDKIVTTSGVNLRSKKQALAFLLEDLRLDSEKLQGLDLGSINSWLPSCPKRNSIQFVISVIEAS
uniref:type IV toxin-antitoxin system AbiEi family antitoxin domain-containing protein n=1 Tax=Algoriphagus sp. TaxID=1872435 RepID=UPI0040477B3A